MTTQLTPYLSFPGTTAREAMEFYRSVFGGKLELSTYGEFGLGEAADAEKVMHSSLEAPGGLRLMGADSMSDEGTPARVSIALFGEDEEELTRFWDALRDGGTVLEELVQAPWGDSFGMCIDRYGFTWQVNIAGAAQGG